MLADAVNGRRPALGLSRQVPAARDGAVPVLVAGAHGGAGATTLAALLSPAWDLGTVPEPGARRGRLRAGGRPVVLVTRGTVPASGRAVQAARVLTDCGAPGLVLVVVGDGLPEPAEARYRFRLLEARCPVVRMPWVPAFRAAASPLLVPLPRKAATALEQIQALARRPVTRPAARP